MMSPTDSDNAPGFVLLEVMVALILVGLVLAPLTELLTQGLARQRGELSQATAANWAQSLMAAQGVAAPVMPGRDTGDLPGGGHWDRLTTAYRDPQMSSPRPAGIRPYDVIVQVSWNENGKPRRYRLESLRLAWDTGAGE